MTEERFQQLPESAQSGHASDEPIDTATLFERCMGNVGFALALLDELEATGPRHVDDIARLIEQGRPAASSDAAHALKGAAAIVGAEQVRRVAAAIELSAARGDLVVAAAQASQLRREMQYCLEQISKVRAEVDG